MFLYFGGKFKIKIQSILSVGENASAYGNLDETGVAVLSESELITAPDGIGNIQSIHCHIFSPNTNP